MTYVRVSLNGMLSTNSSAVIPGRARFQTATRCGPALYAATARSILPPKRSIISAR